MTSGVVKTFWHDNAVAFFSTFLAPVSPQLQPVESSLGENSGYDLTPESL